jgi:sarcosine oxidase
LCNWPTAIANRQEQVAASYDCIVLGVGGFGSAAVYHLARRGVRVLGIEQFTAAHDRGSSHGGTRIIRRAYFEHPDYVPLVDRAYGLWHELAEATGRHLYTPTGLVLAGPPLCEAVKGTRGATREHGLNIHELPLQEARARFPVFQFLDNQVVFYEHDAGYLDVERCVQAHIDAAHAAGADVHFQETAREWTASPDSVTVTTDRATYLANSLIVTAGAWTSRVLADRALPLVVRRKVQFWHPVLPGHIAAHRGSPVFYFELPHGSFYGFPCVDGAMVKVAEHSGGLVVDDPSQVDRGCHEADVAPVREFLRAVLPHVESEPRRHSVCMYTMSPDGHFIVDRHPVHQNVVVAAGFSGHGFKFTPVIGQALADIAMDGRTELPIAFLGLQRFPDTET